MSDISKEKLETEVRAVLEGADLTTVTSKAVRTQLEEKLGIELNHRKKEIDSIIMSAVEEKASSGEEEQEEPEEEIPSDEEDEPPKKKKKKADSDEEEYNPGAKKSKPKPKPKKKKSEDSDDEDWRQSKKKKKKGGPRKEGAFTKSFKLSPELSELMGQDVMPRHMVVKKMWEIIKERNLQDPKMKTFAICDDQMFKLMGVKRFRTFGMMKYLKTHFIEAA